MLPEADATSVQAVLYAVLLPLSTESGVDDLLVRAAVLLLHPPAWPRLSPSDPPPLAREDGRSLRMIHLAAQDGDAAALEACLRAGEPLDARNKRDNTPLHLAAAHG